MRIIKKTNIDFMARSNIAKVLSLIVITLGVFSLIYNNGPKLSIDFKGGTLIAVNYTDTIDINDVRSSMAEVNIEGQVFDFSKNRILGILNPSLNLTFGSLTLSPKSRS